MCFKSFTLQCVVDISDFEPINQELTLSPEQVSEACISVTLDDDDAVEPLETFSISLSTSDGSVVVIPPTITVVITDDDGNYYTL